MARVISQTARGPVWLAWSRVGLGSPSRRPVWAAVSQRRWLSRIESPPGTGVPTPGVAEGSTPSRSEACTPYSFA